MRRPESPRLEHLEDRLVPATFGTPWFDGGHLTISFAPDGTTVGSSQSSLLAGLDSFMSRQEWQGEILRAVQTWVNVSNLDVSLVNDEGQPFGTAGLLQSDLRFGDIRIAMVDLGDNSVSTASPYDPEIGTWSGDILLDSTTVFSNNGPEGTYDLYSVVLHELGHVFGLEGHLNDPNLEDPSSVMFEYYNGTRTTLAESDITAIRSLYGARKADRFEGALGNDAIGTATRFMTAARKEYRQDLKRLETADEGVGVARLVVEGDLTTASDVDWFHYETTRRNPGVSLTLSTAGQSLLQAHLSVYDAAGNLVHPGGTTTENGEITLDLANPAADQVYYFRVAAAEGSPFSVGAYTLRMTASNANVAARLDGIYDTFVANVTDNGAIDTATKMIRAEQSVSTRPTFFANGSVSFLGDLDVYRVTAPRNGALMRTTVIAANPQALPAISLRDAAGTEIDFQVVVAGPGNLVIEVSNLARGDYYITVSDSNPFDYFGDYRLWTQFKLPADDATPVFEDSLDEFNYQQFRGVTLNSTQLLNLEFNVSGTANAALQVLIYDNSGNVLLDQSVAAGSTGRFQLLLGAGQYNIRFNGGHELGEQFSLDFAMKAGVANDPIGPQLIDPSAPPPRDLIPQWTETAYVILSALFDPYGRSYGDYIRWY